MDTRFDPLSDSFRFGEAWPLGATDAAAILQIFQSGIDPALAILEPSFHDALELHHVRERLARMLEADRSEAFGRRAAMVFAALDYFHARVPPPPLAQVHPAGQGAKLAQFLCRRSRESTRAIAPALLAEAGVLVCVPERWVPEALLTSSLRSAIENMGLFEVTEIELELKLPFPGGASWLRRQTLAELQKLRTHLDAGQPWPIVLIPENGDPFDARVMLAFRYEPAGSDAAKIHCYDPSLPAEFQALQMDLRESAAVVGSLSGALQGFHLQGLLCCDYEPTEPPLSFFFRLVHRLWPWTIVWFAWRSLRGWKLRRAGRRRNPGL